MIRRLFTTRTLDTAIGAAAVGLGLFAVVCLVVGFAVLMVEIAGVVR